jgi:phage-related minor tail protein
MAIDQTADAVQANAQYLAQGAAMVSVSKQIEQAVAGQLVVFGSMQQAVSDLSSAMQSLPGQLGVVVSALQSGGEASAGFLEATNQVISSLADFGGASQQAKDLIVGMSNPYVAAGAAVVALAVAFAQGSKESAELTKAIALTGNAAGTTVSELQGMAVSIDATVGTQAKAAEALAALAGSGQVGAENLQQFATTAVLMERNVGVAIGETVRAFAQLGESPVEASRKLNEQHNYLTSAIYSQIKALDEQGLKSEAAALAQQSYDDAMAKVSKAMEGRLGFMERAWQGVGDVAKEAWDLMLGIGRDETLSDKLGDARKRLEEAKQRGPKNDIPAVVASWDKGIANLEREIAVLEKQEQTAKLGAQAERDSANARKDAVNAIDAVDRITKSTLSGQQRLNKELEDYRENLKKIKADEPGNFRLNPEVIRATEERIRSKYLGGTAKPQAGTKSDDSDLISIQRKIDAEKEYIATLSKRGTVEEKLSEGAKLEASIQAELDSGNLSARDRAKKEKELEAARELTKQNAVRAGKEAEISAQSKAEEELKKYADSAIKVAEGIGKAAEAQEALNQAFGKSKTEVERGKLDDLKQARIKEADAGPPVPGRLEAMDKAVAQQERYVSSLVVADFQAIGVQADALLNTAKEQSALAEKDAQMTGLSAVERAKLLALRQVELKYAKELEKLNKLPEGTEKEAQRAKLEEAKRIEGETAVAKVVREDWQKTADQINNSLTDAFMKSLESGKDFGKNLGNALKEQFKNLVLKPTISAIMSPISGALSSAFSGMVNSGAGAAVQAVAGGSGGGGLSTLASGASLLGSVGGAFSSGFSMTLAGGLGTALEGGLAMLGSSTGLSSALAGIGQIAGALGPIGLAVAALLAISKTTKGETRTGGQFGIAYEGSVTNQRRGQTYTYEGQQYDRDFSNGERKALVNGQAYRLEGDPVSDESTIKKAIAGTATSINDLLRMYGSRSTLTSFSAGFETSGKSRGGVFAGGILSTGERFGESGQGDNYSQTLYELTSTNSPDYKTAVENFTTDLQQATLQALKAATDLPKYVSRQLKDVDIEALGATETTALLSKIGDLPNQLLQSFGTSRDVLVQQFAQGLAGGDAAAAGEAVANTLVASIEQTLFTTAAGRIFDTVNAGIIAPMLDAITTGANISEVLSQESIDRTIARAQEQAEAVTLLFNSPDFVAAMERIRTTVGGALGQAGSGVNYTPRYQPVTVAATQSTGELGNAASELGNAVSELVQQFNSAVSSLSSDAKSLQIDLLRAQGKKSEADALERDNYLNPFEKLSASDRATLATQYDVNAATRRAIDAQNERNGLQDELNSLTDDATQALTRQRDALDESNRALFDNVQAIKLQKTIADELPGVVDKYLSPAQRRQSQYDQVTADLNAVGIKVSSEQLMGLSRAQIGSAAMDIYNTAGVPDEARLAVVRAAGALADLKNADVDTAFAALERAVDAQRKVLDEAITELTSVFETARDAAKTLFGEVESAVQFQGDEGRAFISNALAVAQSTGYLPDSEKFSKAVSDATGALGQQMFATQAESDYQRLVLANELKGLQDISGDQLDKAKDELEYLDEQLAEQRKQIDVLNGIDLSVQSVAGAISALGTAMNGARSATTLGGSGLAAYDKELGVGRNAAGTLFQRDDIRLAASDALEAGANPRDIYNVIKGSGFTLAQAGVILGTEPGSLEDFAREMNWPVFHRGTRRVPRTGFALLQQGEAVIPAAYNPFAAGRGWGNSKDMLAAMEGVRAELIEVRRQNDALQRAAMRTADAVNGRPEAPMLVESV